MAGESDSRTTTILFTDLVASSELMQRAGDEQAQRIFKAHHRLLSEAVEAHAGHEVKWLGDGLMVAFDSADAAVRCAIAMQQSSRRPMAGERLAIRAGINIGEVRVDDSDYFGTPVVIARRLCDTCEGGQIIASDLVARLLEGRGLSTKDLGPLDLKGIINKVPAVEIVYEHDPMALLRQLPFVGRQAEYEAMMKRLAEARTGRGSVILLAGEPGIGKTRLTEEFCEHATGDVMVIRGNCYEGDIAAPFGPWSEALRSLIEQTRDEALGTTLGPGAPDLAFMLPEIKRRLPGLEEAPRLDPESERARLFDSIGAVLRNAASTRGGLVIFLDDLHWCDRPSLALLEQVARSIVDRRIVIVGTYRDVEIDRAHPLAQTLAALRRMEHHERIAVRGFTIDSVYDLLNAIEPSERAELSKRELAAVLHAEAEGNPFFIREVLNSLVETGKLAQQDGVWTGNVTSIEDLGIPEGLKEVIGRRLSRLSDSCNKMLQRASAMPGGFTWDELSAISDDPPDELLDALDEALGSQLIAERNRSAYAFTHALVRGTLYDELTTPRRIMLHRRIGEALQALYAGDLEPHLAELAYHFLQASQGPDVAKGVDFAMRAATRAMGQVAYEEAAGLCERALQVLGDHAPSRHDQTCELLLTLGDAQMFAGEPDKAMQSFARAADVARDLRVMESFARAAFGYDTARAAAGPTLLRAEREIGTRLLEEALEGLQDETASRAKILARLASSGWQAEEQERRAALSAEALRIARAAGDLQTLVYTLYAKLSTILAWPQTVHERLAAASEVVSVAEAAGDKERALLGHYMRMHALLELGDIPGVDAELDVYARLADELRIPQYRSWTLFFQSTRALLEGRLTDAERLSQDAVAMQRLLPASLEVSLFAVQTFTLRREQGQLETLEGAVVRFVEQYPEIRWLSALADLHVEIGKYEEARNEFDILAQHDFVDLTRDGNWLIAVSLLSEVCFALGDAQRAGKLYELMLPFADRNVVVAHAAACAGSTSRYLALLAATMSQWDVAARHAEDALAMNTRMRARPWLAHTQHEYAAVLMRRGAPGDRERARMLLDEASATALELGMVALTRRIEALRATG